MLPFALSPLRIISLPENNAEVGTVQLVDFQLEEVGRGPVGDLNFTGGIDGRCNGGNAWKSLGQKGC